MDRNLKIITYNIDGLPEYLDLKDLPWILRPIAWIYKLVKGTSQVRINDGDNKSIYINCISKYLSATDADVIGVQEDFNYHEELTTSLKDYTIASHDGGIYLSKLFSSIECFSHFPLPRFKVDGLGAMFKRNRVSLITESPISWEKSYGYFSHANDLLVHKGFRLYTIVVDERVMLDIYLLHMDADFYHPETCPDVSKDIEARASQLKQLTGYILYRYMYGVHNPIIIMGDTNSSTDYSWDNENIQNFLFEPINKVDDLTIKEAFDAEDRGVDRVFYINNEYLRYHIEPMECHYDYSFGVLSDHLPFVVNFIIKDNGIG